MWRGFHSVSVPLVYRRRSIRLDGVVAANLERVALNDGWEVSDLARVLISFAADSEFLRFENPEKIERLKARSELCRLAGVLGSFLGENPVARPYASRQPGSSSVLRVRFPSGFDDSVVRYAVEMEMSLNEVYALFMQAGLVLHMKAQNALLKALLALNRPQIEGAP